MPRNGATHSAARLPMRVCVRSEGRPQRPSFPDSDAAPHDVSLRVACHRNVGHPERQIDSFRHSHGLSAVEREAQPVDPGQAGRLPARQQVEMNWQHC